MTFPPRAEPLRAFARRVSRALWRPETHSWKHSWSIGIYRGTSPFSLSPAGDAHNPVLAARDATDVDAEFVADPFMLEVGGGWYMFLEVVNRRLHRGHIAVATSADGLAWTYGSVVLAEPFHLSYPYVFKHENEYYMIPETYQQESVRLYQARKFPEQWTFVATLISGRRFADPSIFRHAGKWWLFSETAPDGRHETLRLHWAETLTGPWHEHPKSPIVAQDVHTARPAGRVLVVGDTIIRFAQDCAPVYGLNVQAFEVGELTPQTYSERPHGAPILAGTGSGWNAAGMHHIDAHLRDDGTWIACVDGWCRVPTS
jgi:hypothetical protein